MLLITLLMKNTKGFCTVLALLINMSKFIIGVVTGIMLSTVGFNGLANLGNRALNGIQTFASQNQ